MIIYHLRKMKIIMNEVKSLKELLRKIGARGNWSELRAATCVFVVAISL
jgi:DNA anti-recombination protein RmuC